MVWFAITWDIPSGTPHYLDLPPGFDLTDDWDAACWTVDCSDDGRKICGYYNGVYQGDDYPCMWVDHALQTLTSPDPTLRTNIYPQAMNADGSVIAFSHGNFGDLMRWTAATGITRMTSLAGFDGVPQYGYGAWTNQLLSDDGRIMVGYCYNTTTGQHVNTVWTDGVPANWGNTDTTSHNQSMTGVSPDGSTIMGGGPNGPLGYWRSHVFYSLRGTDYQGTPAPATGRLYGCNYNGTIFYGLITDSYGVSRSCYWDNVTTVNGSYNFTSGPPGVANLYGTMHILLSPAWFSFQDFAAYLDTPMVGGLGGNEAWHAARFDGTTFRNLQPDPLHGPWPLGDINAVNGAGTLLGGQCLDENWDDQPAYWDASHQVHFLPIPPSPGTDPRNFYVMDMNRSGTLMHGSGEIYFTESAVTGVWQIIGAPKGAVGDVWSDPSYVNFSDPAVRDGFIKVDNSWIPLGRYGQDPTGASPISFLSCQDSDDPWDITTAYGQDYAQYSWDADITGTDPDTGLAYPDLTFDVCAVAGGMLLQCGVATRNSITPTWSAVTGAVSYTLRWRVAGTTSWTVVENVPGTSYQIHGLSSNTAIEWQVAPVTTVITITGFTLPPLLSGGGTTGAAYGVSADGNTVVGWVNPTSGDDSLGPRAACYWRNGGPPVVISPPEEAFTEAYGATADGSVIVGATYNQPFIWANGIFTLFDDVAVAAAVYGISADGQTIIGSANVGGHYQACMWNRNLNRTMLGFLPGHTSSNAFDVSDDGTYIVGQSAAGPPTYTTRAFRWSAAGGMQDLGVTAGATSSTGFGVSNDGRTVAINQGSNDPSWRNNAAKWTAAGGIVQLPLLPGNTSTSMNTFANGISGDGSRIYGMGPHVKTDGTVVHRACLMWWENDVPFSPEPLTDEFDTLDLYPYPGGISTDGQVIVGYRDQSDRYPWVYSERPAPPVFSASATCTTLAIDSPSVACGEATRDFITATWGAVEGAVSYTLRWRPAGTTTWFIRVNLTGTSHQIGYLEPATSIEWQVAAVFPP